MADSAARASERRGQNPQLRARRSCGRRRLGWSKERRFHLRRPSCSTCYLTTACWPEPVSSMARSARYSPPRATGRLDPAMEEPTPTAGSQD